MIYNIDLGSTVLIVSYLPSKVLNKLQTMWTRNTRCLCGDRYKHVITLYFSDLRASAFFATALGECVARFARCCVARCIYITYFFLKKVMKVITGSVVLHQCSHSLVLLVFIIFHSYIFWWLFTRLMRRDCILTIFKLGITLV